MRKAFKDFIQQLDQEEFCDIMQTAIGMDKLPAPKNRDATTPPDELAEIYALNFRASKVKDGDDTYTYIPKLVMSVGEDDEIREFPNRILVTENMISHWEERMGGTSNVTLRARYADLVYDFLDTKNDGRRKFQSARLFAETALQLIEHGKTEYDNFFQMIKRGIHFALTLRDDGLVTQYINKLIDLSENDKYANFVFRSLVLDKAIRPKLSGEQLDKLLNKSKMYIESVLNNNKSQSFGVNKIAGDLLKYYAISGNDASAQKLAKDVEADYRKNTYSNSSGILKSNYLGELREMYDEIAQTFPFAKAEVERITAELANISDEINADMTEISGKVQFTHDETNQIKAFIEHLFIDDETSEPRPMSSVIQRMIVNFIPKIEAQVLSFDEATKQSPISYIFTQTFIGQDGFNTATLKGLNTDRERHFVNHYAKNLHFTGFLLSNALRRFINTFTVDEFADAMLQSLVFRNDDKIYIERALKAYWEKDYLPASQLFIPLIEDGFRNLHKVNGLPIMKPNDYGGYDYYSLDHFIEHSMITSVFSAVGGDDFLFYIKIILSNVGRMGWNLRHNFAHGINKSALLNPEVADRLMHIIFCLSLVRQSPKVNTQ